MRRHPLFSTYRQGENRVTASMMAVFERIDSSVVERLLSAASGESALAIVTFANQITGKPESVPDAAVTANCRYLFEVKTTRGSTRRWQLEAHLNHLDGSFADERLFVISPDATKPSTLDELEDSRVVWLSFLALSQAIEELLSDPSTLVGEQTRFLLHELQALFAEDGLLEHKEVVIVAAREAWAEYQRYGAYMCQPCRSFPSRPDPYGVLREPGDRACDRQDLGSPRPPGVLTRERMEAGCLERRIRSGARQAGETGRERCGGRSRRNDAAGVPPIARG